MSITLGFAPDELTVILAVDSDFVAALVTEDEAGWPDGTEIELRFYPVGLPAVVWPATIAGTDAGWNVDVVAVAALMAARPRRVRLYYSDGATTELLWASGEVRVAS